VKKAVALLMLAGALFLLTVVLVFAGDHRFVGVKKCKTCHKSAKKGAQYKQWKESKHAKAYETLGNAQSKEIAKGKGIDNPQKADACLKCHVTAHGVDAALVDSTLKLEEGVSCEACHGPGSSYKKKKTMQSREKSIAAGMIIPDEKLCLKCHNPESPTYKEFKFDEMWKQVNHPNPQKAK
jgi:hypothetical protein